MYFNKNNVVIVNGRRIETNGNSISVTDGDVFIDGKRIDVGDSKTVNIEVTGNVEEISGGFSKIEVNGSTSTVSSMSGNITISGDVAGNVKTMSGNVKVAKAVGGNVNTMSGDIQHKKF